MSFNGVFQCDICSKDKLVKLITLVRHGRLLALKLIKSTKKHILLLREQGHACMAWFRKPLVIRLCIRGVLTKRKINGKMQEPSTLKSEENVDQQNEEPEGEETCLNDYTCKCKTCQNKYGSLPLLLQGIELKSEETRKSKETSPQPSTSSSQHPELRTPKKVLTCQFCSRSFTHRGDYNKHQRKHTKEQPYTCPICKRKFAHNSNLNRHLKEHSGHRPFVCKICDKRFSRNDKLRCHMKSKSCKQPSDNS